MNIEWTKEFVEKYGAQVQTYKDNASWVIWEMPPVYIRIDHPDENYKYYDKDEAFHLSIEVGVEGEWNTSVYLDHIPTTEELLDAVRTVYLKLLSYTEMVGEVVDTLDMVNNYNHST